MRTCIIGAGYLVAAVSAVVSVHSEQVRIWGRDPKLVVAVNEQHENPVYLSGVALPQKVRATTSLEEALSGSELVICATPSHVTREVIGKARDFLPHAVPLLTVAKGIENETLLTMTEVLEDGLPEEYHPYLASLSAPSFPHDIAPRLPP